MCRFCDNLNEKSLGGDYCFNCGRNIRKGFRLMKVSELIKKLQKVDQDRVVIIQKDSEGKIYLKNINEYAYREVCDDSGQCDRSRFTYLNKKHRYFYEGTTDDRDSEATKSTSQEINYDDYGNVKEIIGFNKINY